MWGNGSKIDYDNKILTLNNTEKNGLNNLTLISSLFSVSSNNITVSAVIESVLAYKNGIITDLTPKYISRLTKSYKNSIPTNLTLSIADGQYVECNTTVIQDYEKIIIKYNGDLLSKSCFNPTLTSLITISKADSYLERIDEPIIFDANVDFRPYKDYTNDFPNYTTGQVISDYVELTVTEYIRTSLYMPLDADYSCYVRLKRNGISEDNVQFYANGQTFSINDTLPSDIISIEKLSDVDGLEEYLYKGTAVMSTFRPGVQAGASSIHVYNFGYKVL